MGSDGGRANEAPAHDVWVDAFHLALRPVTRAEYQIFLDATHRPPPRSWSDERFDDPEQPAVAVSWFDAAAYCEWLSRQLSADYRLPTEAEREKASRGGMEDREYPWGDGPPDWMDTRYRGDEVERPDHVGQDPPNGYGLHNMGDLVHEWCSDWYDAGYYAVSPERNPAGPASGQRRASRGGSWRHAVKGRAAPTARRFCPTGSCRTTDSAWPWGWAERPLDGASGKHLTDRSSPMPPGQPQETPYTALEPPAPGPRVIHFPEDRSFGEIVVRDWGSPVHGGYRSDWKDLGFRRASEARGPVSVPGGQEAGLALAEGVEGFGEGLSLLQPGDLQYVFTGWHNSVTWTDDDCRHLPRLRGLVWVSLVGTSISDEGLRWLGGMRGLRHLDLHRIPGLTDEGIAHLSGLTRIESFFCTSRRITDASMAVFPRGVTWRGVAELYGKPLTTIVMNWGADGGNRNIDDAALEQLVPLWERTPTLTGLDLGMTAITDAGLRLLQRLKQLEWIYVGDNEGVTEEGVAALEAALPKVGGA